MNFNNSDSVIAYFTMEIGLNSEMKTYSGGLGILAGDTMRTFADVCTSAVAVTQLNQKGYCEQKLDEEGEQVDSPDEWNPENHLEKLPVKTSVEIEGNEVKIGAWRKVINSPEGSEVSVIFLDTDLEENKEKYREITSWLYRGDQRFRLFQEIVLGIGGFRILQELGYDVEKYHMNESHSSLLALELLKESGMKAEKVREKCVFTTHTPEESGHDKFPYELIKEVLGDYISIDKLKELSSPEKLHMTLLAMNLSGYTNAVSKIHEEVSERMFPEQDLDSITNGVHTLTWVSENFRKLYDKHIPGWRKDLYKLKYGVRIPEEEIWDAHLKEKKKLIQYVNKNKKDVEMNERVFTIGFARRATPYKRPNLLFFDPERLSKIDQEVGDFQVIYAGKAHPQGEYSKEMIKQVNKHMKELSSDIEMAYLENYDIDLAELLTSGVDLWLNTPERGREACGTSGMKAACNGIPQLGTLDGWWVEGHLEGVTGWKIGLEPEEKRENADEIDAEELYDKLEEDILPKYYANKKDWIRIMRNCIAYNASFFNTHRMIREYILNAYS